MPRGHATAKQLNMLTDLLNRYCRQHAVDDEAGRQEIAATLLWLFDEGVRDAHELEAKLCRLGTLSRHDLGS